MVEITLDLVYYKDDPIIKQHIQFIMNQKRNDGKIGYINPLIQNGELDIEKFYKINLLSYLAVKKLYGEEI